MTAVSPLRRTGSAHKNDSALDVPVLPIVNALTSSTIPFACTKSSSAISMEEALPSCERQPSVIRMPPCWQSFVWPRCWQSCVL